MTTDRDILQQIYDDEETDNIIYSIREELMANVMKECYQIYLEKQTVRFVVQCAYDALVKFLSFQFYYHHPVPNARDPLWTPDTPVDPSPKDTWSAGAIPVRTMEKEEEQDKVDAQDVKNDMLSCTCPKILECTCKMSEEELMNKLTQKFSPYQYDTSQINVTPDSKISAEEIKCIMENTDQSKSNLISPTAVETTIVTATHVTDPKQKKKKEKPQIREQKQEIPEQIVRGSQASVVKLPPVRISTKLQAKPNEKKKKKKY